MNRLTTSASAMPRFNCLVSANIISLADVASHSLDVSRRCPLATHWKGIITIDNRLEWNHGSSPTSPNSSISSSSGITMMF
jgi:hypothetical protein